MDDPIYADPYENWNRLVKTRELLETSHIFTKEFYDENAGHIKAYLTVLKATPDCDNAAQPYLETLVDQYELLGYFNPKIYLMAIGKLMNSKEDYDLQKEFNQMMSF